MSNPSFIPVIPGLQADPEAEPGESLRPAEPDTERAEDGTPVGRSDLDADIRRTRPGQDDPDEG